LCLLCECVQFQHSSLHCFGSRVDLRNLVKIEGCSLTFLSSLDRFQDSTSKYVPQ
jgi:hypothetical protein